MRMIGLIGGLSWESSAEYYKILNRRAQARLGGLHSARCLMYSFDFGEIEALQAAGLWDEASLRMVEAAKSLEAGGADFVLICSNTMHRMADAVAAAIACPLLHIADAAARPILAAGYRKVGLLGTRFTMAEPFYKDRLTQRYGLSVLVPDETDAAIVDSIIYDELVRGIVRDDSRAAYRGIIAHLAARGAEAIILGCTEIMLLVRPEDSPVPLFDTTALHAEAAIDMAFRP